MGVFGVYTFEYKTKALLQDLVVVCSAGMSVQSSALLLAAVSPWVRHHNIMRVLTGDGQTSTRQIIQKCNSSVNFYLDLNLGEAADGGSRR